MRVRVGLLRGLATLTLTFATMILCGSLARAGTVCDPAFPGNCLKPTANGGLPGSPVSTTSSNGLNGSGHATDTTSTSLHAAVPSKSIYIQGWTCGNSGATSVEVSFQDGSGGATIGEPIECPAGGANNISPGGQVWGKTTAGNALFFAASGSSTTVRVWFVGFSS